jgi:hypothetical protein
MSPPKDKIRLIPNTYVWTQSFVMILLMLKAAEQTSSVRKFFDANKGKLRQSIDSMLAWLDDMKQMDDMAEWGSRLLKPLYRTGAVWDDTY